MALRRSQIPISPSSKTQIARWSHLKFRLLLLYLLISLVLLALGLPGQLRLINEVGHTFGGFIWGLDADGQT